MNLLAVAFASLVGSLHCGAMCGGIAACVGGSSPAGVRDAAGRTLAYHTARLVGYLVLGGVAGLLGASVDGFGRAALGFANVAGILMGLVLLALAVRQLRPVRARPLVQLRTGATPRGAALLSKWLPRRDTTGAAVVGLLTAVLPCGWLWSFVALAAAQADVGGGAAIMAAMWLGTLPALTTVGVGSAWLGRALGRHAPKITAAVLFALAIASLTGRLMPTWTADEGEAPASCH